MSTSSAALKSPSISSTTANLSVSSPALNSTVSSPAANSSVSSNNSLVIASPLSKNQKGQTVRKKQKVIILANTANLPVLTPASTISSSVPSNKVLVLPSPLRGNEGRGPVEYKPNLVEYKPQKVMISSTASNTFVISPVMNSTVSSPVPNSLVSSSNPVVIPPPLNKNQKGQVVRKKQKLIVINFYKSLLKRNPEITNNKAAQEISERVSIGVRKIRDIIAEYKMTGTVKSPKITRKCTNTNWGLLSDTAKTQIRRKIHEFFFRSEIPNLKKVLEAVNEDDELPNFRRTTLYRVLRRLQFKFKRVKDGLIMDRDEIVTWRRSYLREIQQHRNAKRKIYYTDETVINADLTKNKSQSDESVTSATETQNIGVSTGSKHVPNRNKRLIITHIGSEDGFVDGGFFLFESNKSGDYHEDINSNVYEEWFTSVLPELQPNSVIVLDNAPYHCHQLNKIPTSNSPKSDMLEWLKSNGTEVDGDDYVRAELLHMIKQLSGPKQYVIDNLANQHGHTVVRLPPYHFELNAIELIWTDLKTYVARNNKSCTLAEVKDLILRGISQIGELKWQKCIDHVINSVEINMWEIDDIVEQLVEPLLTNITESDSDSDDSQDELSS